MSFLPAGWAGGLYCHQLGEGPWTTFGYRTAGKLPCGGKNPADEYVPLLSIILIWTLLDGGRPVVSSEVWV